MPWFQKMVNQRKDWWAFNGIIGKYSLVQSIDSFVGKKAACNSRNLSLTVEKNLQRTNYFKPKPNQQVQEFRGGELYCEKRWIKPVLFSLGSISGD